MIIEKDEEDTSNQKITEPKQGSSKDAIAEDKARETILLLLLGYFGLCVCHSGSDMASLYFLTIFPVAGILSFEAPWIGVLLYESNYLLLV